MGWTQGGEAEKNVVRTDYYGCFLGEAGSAGVTPAPDASGDFGPTGRDFKPHVPKKMANDRR